MNINADHMVLIEHRDWSVSNAYVIIVIIIKNRIVYQEL